MGNIAGHLSWERVLTSNARVRGILQGAPAKVPRPRLTRLRSVIPDVEVASKNFSAFPQILKLYDLRTTTLRRRSHRRPKERVVTHAANTTAARALGTLFSAALP